MTAAVAGSGKVWIVGAGPGDPDLLTVRAARLIQEVDDLVVDGLVPPELYARCDARVVYVGKRAGRPRPSQERIGGILVELARRGRRVVRLKGGDPSIFGRLSEELDALDAAGVAWELVPGVSSVQASALVAGVPLTDRDLADRFVVMTGHRRSGLPRVPELPPYDAQVTLVWLMPLATISELVAMALEAGYPSLLPTVAVSRATLAGEVVVASTLAGLPAAIELCELESPATVLVGRVAERAVKAASSHHVGWRSSAASGA